MSQRTLKFNNLSFRVDKASFAGGGQGKVFHATDPASGKAAIYKTLERPDDKSTQGKIRLRYLIDQQVGASLPQVCPPLALQEQGGEVGYLTLRAPGVALDQDRPRRFPERLELAWILACHWSRLEALGLAHGDVAHSNFTVTPDGEVWVIDTDGFATTDPTIPKPTMVGQHPFLAPEIRRARNRKSPISATINSDRFAWAVLLNCVLLNRHPTDGLKVSTPAKFDKVMMSGTWPERSRRKRKGETSIAALGDELPALFDLAFTNDPADGRPSGDDWRCALGRALQNMTQHKCGNVFVSGQEKKCSWCGRRYHEAIAPQGHDRLTIRLKSFSSSKTATFTVRRGERLILGRNNLPDASGYVSVEHLVLSIVGNDLQLENLGRNGSLITQKGKPQQRLARLMTTLPATALHQAELTLADKKMTIEFLS